MDFFQLLSDIEKADPEFLDRINPRRRVFKYLGNTGKKITAAAAPAILASFFNRAYGQTATLPTTVTAVLDLALQLEYLEYYFYSTALATPGLVPSADVSSVTTIFNDEAGHINALRGIPGWTPRADPGRAAFDYSGGSGSMTGPLAGSLTLGAPNQQVLLYGSAQAFSDTGMRAYKGGAPVLNTTATKDILEAALNIHSVEARHNSHFRSVRRALVAATPGVATAPAVAPYDAAPKSWISNLDNGGPVLPSGAHPAAAVYNAGNPATGTPDASYPAESNTTQSTVMPTTLNAAYTATAVAEAFDEPLDPTTVKTIAKMFVTPVSGLFV